jgi:general secretion pathway protein G
VKIRKPTIPSKGFTLIEMLVVLAMLGVLAVLSLPMVDIVVQRDREQQLRRALWVLRDAIDDYKLARESGALPRAAGVSLYPPTLQALTQLHTDARPQAQGRPLRFLRDIPRDPFADAKLAAADTWVLRSFLSEASNPKPGADVYDVHSSSNGKALDGTWLKDW